MLLNKKNSFENNKFIRDWRKDTLVPILFIVEGGKHEFTLIKRIFFDILGYKRIEKRRSKANYYVSNADSHVAIDASKLIVYEHAVPKS